MFFGFLANPDCETKKADCETKKAFLVSQSAFLVSQSGFAKKPKNIRTF
jgi:hypothetical protein